MPKSDSVVIDPVKMNIINKISAGSTTSGNLSFNGGLLLQGHHVGELTVSGGPLVILEDASVSGKVTVQGDVWVFGRIGSTEPDAVPTHMTVHGVLNLSAKSRASGKLRCEQLAPHLGAIINGDIETLTKGAVN